MPRVLNKRTDVLPPDAVYVGRPTHFGNPFKVGAKYQGRQLTQQDAVDAYSDWVNYSDEGQLLLPRIKSVLKGKDLVCWCAPKPCHADILLEIANAS